MISVFSRHKNCVIICIALCFSGFLHAQDSGTLTKEEKEQIEKRKQARIKARYLLNEEQRKNLDDTLVSTFARSDKTGDASIAAIRKLLEAGAHPDNVFALKKFSIDDPPLAQRIELLLEYGSDLIEFCKYQGFPKFGIDDYPDFRDSPVQFSLLSAALEHSIKKDDLTPLKDMVAVFRKYGIMNLKVRLYDVGGIRYRCTLAGLFWELSRSVKKLEHQSLCTYFDQNLENNFQFVKSLFDSIFTFDISEKYKNISKDWQKTRKPIEEHRKYWGKSIQRSNFFTSIAIALDPEPQKCEWENE